MSQSQSISNLNNLQKCVRYLNSFFLQLLCSLVPDQLRSDAQLMIQQTSGDVLRNVKQRSFNLMGLLSHLVTAQAAKEITRLRVFIQTRKVTGRLIAGVFLAGFLAPLSDIFYAFDFLKQFEVWRVETNIAGWYYENYAYLFLCLGPYLFMLFFGFGLLFMFTNPKEKKIWLLSLAVAYPVIKILWLTQVNSDAEFHAIPAFAFWIYGTAMAVCLWFVAEYLVYLFNHKVLNCLSTLSNITNNRDKLPAEQAVEMYATTCEKLKSII